MMEWYEKLDFDDNPFSTDPRENHEKLVGMDEIVEEMVYRINSGSMLVIEGGPGTGKTTLLMIAAKKFGGNKNVVYVNCEKLDKKLNITHVLQDKYGFLGRVLNKKPKNMVVLMDNVHRLSKENTERLKFYFDQNYIKSIIFTTQRYSQVKFSDSLKDRIGKRIVKIPKLEEYEAVELVNKRTGDTELFNDQIITKLFKTSGNSPKKLLEACTLVSQEAARKDRNRVQMADLKVLESDKK